MIGAVIARSMADARRGLLGWGIGLAVAVVAMSTAWPQFDDVDFRGVLGQYPQALEEVLRISTMGTPAGFLNAELFRLVLPVLFIVYGIGRGARLLAVEEEQGSLEVIAALPISRTQLLVGKAISLTASVAVLAAVLTAATVSASALVDMDLPAAHVANAGIALFLLGTELGLVTLAAGAVAGRRAVAVGVGSAAAGAAVLVFLLGQLLDALEPVRGLSPVHQAVAGGPIGPELPAAALAMPAVSLLALAIALPVFDRRDLTA